VAKFWELLEESVLVSGFIACACIVAMLYLAVRGLPIPDILSNVVMVVVGFFFGGKVQLAQQNLARQMGRPLTQIGEENHGRYQS